MLESPSSLLDLGFDTTAAALLGLRVEDIDQQISTHDFSGTYCENLESSEDLFREIDLLELDFGSHGLQEYLRLRHRLMDRIQRRGEKTMPRPTYETIFIS